MYSTDLIILTTVGWLLLTFWIENLIKSMQCSYI